MKAVTEGSWRQQLWSDMLARLPASITINVSKGSYTVRDNSLQFIYSGDIDEAGVDELIGELSMELFPAERNEFLQAFSMNELKNAWKDGCKGYTLHSKLRKAGEPMLRTDVLFGQGVWDMIVEFRFEQIDFNMLLSERARWAENVGSR